MFRITYKGEEVILYSSRETTVHPWFNLGLVEEWASGCGWVVW